MIEVSQLSFGYKKYGQNNILNCINMTAFPGEITAVIGANGIGKSTILKNICGLLKGSGEIKICGKNIREYKRKDLAAHISYLSQDTASNSLLSVFEVVLLGRVARLSASVPDEELTIVRDVLRRLSMEKYASRNIGELSGGQRQLVFIAQALARNPKVLVMDEPTSNLDLYYQFQIMNLLKELTVTEKFTTLVSLHQLDLVARFADKVFVINDGCVYDYGTPEKTLTAKTFRDVYRMNTEIVNKGGASYVLPLSQYTV